MFRQGLLVDIEGGEKPLFSGIFRVFCEKFSRYKASRKDRIFRIFGRHLVDAGVLEFMARSMHHGKLINVCIYVFFIGYHFYFFEFQQFSKATLTDNIQMRRTKPSSLHNPVKTGQSARRN